MEVLTASTMPPHKNPTFAVGFLYSVKVVDMLDPLCA